MLHAVLAATLQPTGGNCPVLDGVSTRAPASGKLVVCTFRVEHGVGQNSIL